MDDIIRIEDGNAILDPDAAARFAEFERQAKRIKKAEDELKKAVLAAMERHNVIKLDTDELSISYVAATERETFDTKRFRAENPDTYDDYVRFSKVKPSVRVRLK